MSSCLLERSNEARNFAKSSSSAGADKSSWTSPSEVVPLTFTWLPSYSEKNERTPLESEENLLESAPGALASPLPATTLSCEPIFSRVCFTTGDTCVLTASFVSPVMESLNSRRSSL
eukprot:TRINITY_DN1867_c0_g1_i1.p4 TRINITY_DN1867_c0_g1~~TRINITY_DN1867_c0_g1_i1.p4  ORF type:complete len:117 (-),score=24.34 TRINITY_DN1867_c0_g1_i1:334-684(-)